MKLIGIYKITSPSGKIYIGQSIDIKRRFRYYNNLKCKQQPKLYNSFLKYGVDAHKFEIIELCMQKYLNNMERYYQEKYNTVNSGLNLLYVKSDHFSGGHSEESKKKISETLKGRPISENTRAALLLSNKTRVLSAESIEKFRKASTGKKFTQESKDKMSKARLGKKHSQETVQKKIDSSPNKKAVLQYDLNNNFIAEHESVRAANRALGKSQRCTAINQMVAGDLKTAFGFKWRYKDC
jgi:group I intron endonuclease